MMVRNYVYCATDFNKPQPTVSLQLIVATLTQACTVPGIRIAIFVVCSGILRVDVMEEKAIYPHW